MSVKLECPYTGRTITMMCVQMSPKNVWMQKGAWSPNRVFRDSEDARIQLSRRGREWLSKDAPLMCPYTGAPIVLQDAGDGKVRAVGAYDPDVVYADPRSLEYFLAMRGGAAHPETEMVTEPIVVDVVEPEPPEIVQEREIADRKSKVHGKFADAVKDFLVQEGVIQ